MKAAKKIIILGGGTAGWMCAAALARKSVGTGISITLIESEAVGTVGVGESTIPHIRSFNQFLGIDEREFIKQTSATFKLGIKFNGWGAINSSYFHPFGSVGHDIGEVEFQHYWVRAKSEAMTDSYNNFSLSSMAMQHNKFALPQSSSSGELGHNYAYHIDATLYAQYLKRYSMGLGVIHVEGRVIETTTSNEGELLSLQVDSLGEIQGDFFIDCSGFQAILIGGVLQSSYESWKKWLPCDRAIAVPCARTGDLNPYTIATAHTAGWSWRIPLQHRTGNGCVYSSEFMDDHSAMELLTSKLEGGPLAPPKRFRFEAGVRPQQWRKNCVAIGLSAGFLEPLESTSIYLVQVGIQNLIELFPLNCISPEVANEFNNRLLREYVRIRDFIIMHYAENSRDDSEFWRYCRNMELPESLAKRQFIFKSSGHVDHRQFGVYAAVCVGQGAIPASYDPRVDVIASARLSKYLNNIAERVCKKVEAMEDAEKYIDGLLVGALQ